MRMAGMDEIAVKRILGHADKDVTDHYTHINVSFLRKEILKMK
jgi:integrase/recombinase XerD